MSLSPSPFISFKTKYDYTVKRQMNRTTRHITCSHSCPLQRTVKWNSNTNGKKIEKCIKNQLGPITNLNYIKLCEIDLFNSALKTCKTTKSTVSGSEFQHVVTCSLKKFVRNIMSVSTLTELDCMTTCDLTRTENKQTDRPGLLVPIQRRLCNTNTNHCGVVWVLNYMYSIFTENYKILTVSMQFFFSERVTTCLNSLPDTVDFRSFTNFNRTVNQVNFTQFLRIQVCN